MTKFATLFTSLCTLALAAGGCNDDSSKTKYEASSLPTLCEQTANALCDHAVQCGVSATLADCAPYGAQLEAGCLRSAPDVQAKIDAGSVSVDYARASACLEEVATSCAGALDSCLGSDDVIVGKLAVGAACGSHQECAGTGYCKVEGNACAGTCAARGADGAACSGDPRECAAGLMCKSGVCGKGGAEGAACSDAAPCADQLGCDHSVCKTSAQILAACPVEDPTCNIGGRSCGGSIGGETVCHFTFTTYGASGAACDPSDAEPASEDVERACKLGLICDADAKTCGPAKATGADCGGDDELCGIGGYCDASDQCAPLPAKGQACTSTCDNDLVCVRGVCATPLVEGAACSDDQECASSECSDGHCVAECTTAL